MSLHVARTHAPIYNGNQAILSYLILSCGGTDTKTQAQSPHTIHAFSLFSGCGGCSLGFRKAGIDVALAADIDADACATYAMNLGLDALWPRVDLSTVTPDALLARSGLGREQLDLIVGGPPCQGFSSAGVRDWDDPRSALLKRFVELVTALRPTWFIMENVEGLLTAHGGFWFIEAITRFLNAGYWIRANKIYMEQYGLPQRRKRVFVVGNLEHCAFDFPSPTHTNLPPQLWASHPPLLSVLDAIGDLQDSTDSPTIYSRTPMNGYQRHLRRVDGRPVLHHRTKPLNTVAQQRIQHLRPGETMKHLPQELQHPSFGRRALRRVMDGTPTERRGGAPSGLKRLLPDEPCLTITSASACEFVHPLQDRLLTLRECARIQSFPDWYEFRGSWSSIATQIGNAIPPRFMEQLATHILHLATWRRASDQHGRWLGIDATKASGMSPALAHMLGELEERTLAFTR